MNGQDTARCPVPGTQGTAREELSRLRRQERTAMPIAPMPSSVET